MGRRKHVTIDIGELAWAFEDHDYDHLFYLDLDTGEVLSNVGDEEPDVLEARVEAGLGTRYLAVPSSEPSEGYGDMEDFIGTVGDPTLRAMLVVAIQGAGAFRRFKDVLLTFPEERERWFAFRDARTKERLEEWLEEEDVKVVWTGGI
jgi:hypothetical protein